MPVFMVRHNVAGWSGDEAPVIFVTAGVESAVARAVVVAGDGIVGVGVAVIVVASTAVRWTRSSSIWRPGSSVERRPNRGSLVNRCQALQIDRCW
jgi:hypothetical protein